MANLNNQRNQNRQIQTLKVGVGGQRSAKHRTSNLLESNSLCCFFVFSIFTWQLSKFLSWLTSRLISVTSGFLPINLQMPITPAKVYFSFFSNPFVVVGQKSKVFRVGNKLLPHSNSKLPSVFVWQVFSRSQANLHQGRCV